MDASRITLREARPGDLPAIRELVFEVMAPYGFDPEPDGADRDLFETQAYFAEGGYLAVLAEKGDDGAEAIVGMVGVIRRATEEVQAETTAELRKLYLAQRWHGHGLGRRLLEAALEFARAAGYERIVLETSGRLGSAISLYERAGFRPSQAVTRSHHCDLYLVLEIT